MPDPVFLRPPDGWVGDVIPFAVPDGVDLYYLHDRRDPVAYGTSWNRYSTSDFDHYDYRGVALPHGALEDQDLNAYTGSLVDHDGRLHLFYTGVNPINPAPGRYEPTQMVMHAVSEDSGTTWTKFPDQSFGAPAGYDPADWRDPFVFRSDPHGPWRMLIAARQQQGPERRRGVIAQCVSEDLVTWRTVDPFWAPDRYVALECPEVFFWNGWWYLVFSEFSDRFATHYRISDSPSGPWQVPDRDTIDGRAFYAAKSAALGDSRYFAGWIATREGESDAGAWNWAGHLAVHEATQATDGSIDFRMPTALRATFTEHSTPLFVPVLGRWKQQQDSWALVTHDGYGVAVAPTAPDQYLLEVTVVVGENTTECGVILRSSADGDEGYQIRLEPRASRMVFDRWPRESTGPAQWQISGDVPQAIELERPVRIAPGRHRLSVLVDGSACIAYLNDSVAMSARMYDRRTGGIGLFVGEGSATFTGVLLATRQESLLKEEK